MKFKFSKIYIDQEAVRDRITRRVLRNYPDIDPEIVRDRKTFTRYLNGMSLTEGKRTLWLTRFKGDFLKPCPGTATSYRCCNYLVINQTTNCPIDCTYCILQSYVSNPAITVCTNSRQIIEEIETVSRLNSQRIVRIGTGELTDSLALDPITGLGEELMTAVKKHRNVLLELKSKTNNIHHLLNLNPERIVLSWSVNPQSLVESDEHKSAGIEKRLAAACRAARKGYLIGLHFDPIIYSPHWKRAYRELIEQIGRRIDPGRIAWISLGSLRFPPRLKQIALSRFPRSRIFSGEQLPGTDGKMRYIRPLRLEMYRAIVRLLRKKLGDIFIYFCMESPEIWAEILGKNPANNNQVDWYFATSLTKKFPGLGMPTPVREVYEQPVCLPDQGTCDKKKVNRRGGDMMSE